MNYHLLRDGLSNSGRFPGAHGLHSSVRARNDKVAREDYDKAAKLANYQGVNDDRIDRGQQG